MGDMTNYTCSLCGNEHKVCNTCGERTNGCIAKLCNNCWEVESRLEKYLESKKAQQKIKKYLENKKEEKYSGVIAKL